MRAPQVLPCALLAATLGGCAWAAYTWPSTSYRRWLRRLYREARQAWRRLPTEVDEPLNTSGPPVCRPLTNVTQLLTWQPPCPPEHDPCACTLPLQPVGQPSSGDPQASARPKLLVCHDMAGGYHEDRHPWGSSDPGAYSLWHWGCVDVFVYFSHHLVTVPPVGWIRAAHRHGVQVLGTFITEWDLGASRCRHMFSSRAAAQAVADQLVALAAHYCFEGWLINIENSLSGREVQVMLHFVAYLRARLRATVPHGMVMWYDAVTTEGELLWQNALNSSNYPFFDAADAIFINYGWRPPTAAATAAAAGQRRADVYMGVDVFGRGTYGGGGWDSDVGLAAARAEGLSAALFAPGWVLECNPREQFASNQERYWQKVAAAWGSNRLVLGTLPCTTTFDCGAGYCRFKRGAVDTCGTTSTAPWWDLSRQQLLPLLHGGRGAGGRLVTQLTLDTAWEGGSCLMLTLPPLEASVPLVEHHSSSSSSGCGDVDGGGVVPCLRLFQLAPEATAPGTHCSGHSTAQQQAEEQGEQQQQQHQQVLKVRLVCSSSSTHGSGVPPVHLALWASPAGTTHQVTSQGTSISRAVSSCIGGIVQMTDPGEEGAADQGLLLPAAKEGDSSSSRSSRQPIEVVAATSVVQQDAVTSSSNAAAALPEVQRLAPVQWARAPQKPEQPPTAAAAAEAGPTPQEQVPEGRCTAAEGAYWHQVTWRVPLGALQQHQWAITGVGVGWDATAAVVQTLKAPQQQQQEAAPTAPSALLIGQLSMELV